MELIEAIVSCVCVGVFALLGLAVLVWVISATVREHKQNKKNDAWEAEKQQMERERAIRDAEYHTARMKELERK